MQCGECSTTTYPATFALQCQLLSLQNFASFVWLLRWIPLLFPLCCSCLLISFSFSKKINKYKIGPWSLLPDTEHRQPLVLAPSQCVTPLCYLFISQSNGGSVSLTGPGQNTAEHCNFTPSQQINLSAWLAMNLPGLSGHTVWLLHLTLERLHPLKLGMHLCCLEIPFYLHAILGITFEKKRQQVKC